MQDRRTEEGSSAAPTSSWYMAAWVQPMSPCPRVLSGCSGWHQAPFLCRSGLKMPVLSHAPGLPPFVSQRFPGDEWNFTEQSQVTRHRGLSF